MRTKGMLWEEHVDIDIVKQVLGGKKNPYRFIVVLSRQVGDEQMINIRVEPIGIRKDLMSANNFKSSLFQIVIVC